jgi:hypothetical protein
VHHRLGNAQQQPERKQPAEAGKQGGNGGQQAPDAERGCHRVFGTVAIDEPAGWYLERGIGPEEGRVRQAPIGVGELEKALELRIDHRDRQVHPVDIGDHARHGEQHHHPPTA